MNTFYSSKNINNRRARYAYLRKELQSKGTRSAKRKLKRLSGRERRFVTDVNHCISKQIVNAEYTVFALEDLSKIRVQKRRGKEFDRKLNNWSFYLLEQFLGYKAEVPWKACFARGCQNTLLRSVLTAGILTNGIAKVLLSTAYNVALNSMPTSTLLETFLRRVYLA